MRVFFVAGMLAVTASAQAGSIDRMTSSKTERSFEKISCDGCAPLKSKREATPEIVLEPGTQRIEVRDVDGTKKVFRTESWLGGSPVTYVTVLGAELGETRSADAEPVIEDLKEDAIVIDTTATTSAVNAAADAIPVPPAAQTGKKAEIKAFDPASLQLRLN